jgi:SAM-dependent methyltransferase
MTKTLDLGCGGTPRNPYEADEFYGVDIASWGDENIVIADLAIEPIPFEDGTFDYVTAFDFLEHIPRVVYLDGKARNSFIEVMNEVYRVLLPGGIFYAVTPAFPNEGAFSDPTHVNYITGGTSLYFTGGYNNIGKEYGFNGMFEVVHEDWHPIHNHHRVWELKAVK